MINIRFRRRRQPESAPTVKEQKPPMKSRPRVPISTVAETGDPYWNGLPADYWIRTVKRWEQQLAKNVPERDQGFGEGRYLYGPWGLLRTSRNLFRHSGCVAEFAPLAVLVAYQAVEAALQTVYYDHRHDSFEKLTDRAAKDGRLKGDAVAWTHHARQMRNLLSTRSIRPGPDTSRRLPKRSAQPTAW